MPKPTDEPQNGRPLLRQKAWEGEQKIEKTAVSDAALALINRLTPEPVTEADVWTGKMKLANDQLDRSYEKFSLPVLNRFVETLIGKSVMVAHDYGTRPVGRVYDAELRKDAAGHHVLTHFFMDADGTDTPAVRKGIMGHVSIGFDADKRICSLDGKDYDAWDGGTPAGKSEEPCDHIKGRTYDGKLATVTWAGDMQKTEGQEASFVWLGCQRGAEMTRALETDDTRKAAHFDALAAKANGKGEAMDEKEKAALEAKLKALEAEVARLTPLAKDGESYRTHLKAEIGRLHTSMEEAATGATLLKHLDAADAEALESVRKDADARHAKLFEREKDGGRLEGEDAPPKKRTAEQILNGEGE